PAHLKLEEHWLNWIPYLKKNVNTVWSLLQLATMHKELLMPQQRRTFRAQLLCLRVPHQLKWPLPGHMEQTLSCADRTMMNLGSWYSKLHKKKDVQLSMPSMICR